MSHDTISPRRPLAPLLFRIALVAVALIMVASVVLQRITLSGYYQIIPGSARAVGPLISVSGMPSTTRAAGGVAHRSASSTPRDFPDVRLPRSGRSR